MTRRLLVYVLATGLLIAGCGASTSDLSTVSVSEGKEPKLTVDQTFSTSQTQVRVLSAGDGIALSEGETVKAKFLVVNGRTGKELNNSFISDLPISITLSPSATLPGIVTALTGRRIGDRLLVAVAPADGRQLTDKHADIKAGDTMLFVLELTATVPQTAVGPSSELPARLPRLRIDSDNQPVGFESTGHTQAAPQQSESHTVIAGDGPPLRAGQSVVVHYLGQIYPDGAVFDSSWQRGRPTEMTGLNEFTECWDEHLMGKTVGSRIVLVCPAAAVANEDTASDVDTDDTLLFAVDLLDAS